MLKNNYFKDVRYNLTKEISLSDFVSQIKISLSDVSSDCQIVSIFRKLACRQNLTCQILQVERFGGYLTDNHLTDLTEIENCQMGLYLEGKTCQMNSSIWRGKNRYALRRA